MLYNNDIKELVGETNFEDDPEKLGL